MLFVGLAFGSGIVTVLSPWILPVLQIIISRSIQSLRSGSIAIVGGSIGGFAVTGSFLGVVASWTPNLPNALRVVAIAILLEIGVLSMFPAWGYRYFQYFSINANRSK
jgi:cytochrome c-type biogenesis protein